MNNQYILDQCEASKAEKEKQIKKKREFKQIKKDNIAKINPNQPVIYPINLKANSSKYLGLKELKLNDLIPTLEPSNHSEKKIKQNQSMN